MRLLMDSGEDELQKRLRQEAALSERYAKKKFNALVGCAKRFLK